jgi:hypothetical protein
VLRWKRPGRIEDHKAWSIDRCDGGIGFCTLSESRPQVGEIIHVRVLDRDRWMTVEQTVRVARTDPTPGGELVLVGCALEPLHSADRVAPTRAEATA